MFFMAIPMFIHIFLTFVPVMAGVPTALVSCVVCVAVAYVVWFTILHLLGVVNLVLSYVAGRNSEAASSWTHHTLYPIRQQTEAGFVCCVMLCGVYSPPARSRL
jgi:hypothetical protein